MPVLVTGLGGQLGQALLYESYIEDVKFIFTNREILDITSKESLDFFFSAYDIDTVINCAAYTNVELAEVDYKAAHCVNVDGVRNLVQVVQKFSARLIHISTDYVFDGSLGKEYQPESNRSPLNAYGRTKALGEDIIINSETNSIVIRTSWLYSRFGKNFYNTVKYWSSETRGVLQVVNDQFGSPTCASSLAKLCISLVKIPINMRFDYRRKVYHFSNRGKCSWYEFACQINDSAKLALDIRPITSAQYSSEVKRPECVVLDSRSICNDFGVEINHWKLELDTYIADDV